MKVGEWVFSENTSDPRDRTQRVFTEGAIPLVFVILFVVFFSIIVIPYGIAMFGAFWSGQPWEKQGYLTLSHFISLIQSPNILDILWNTVVVSIVATVICVGGGAIIVLLIARSKIPYRNVLFVFTFLPFILPGYIIAVGWIFLMDPEIGLVNSWLFATFGISIPFYNEWWIGIIIGTHYIPFMYFLMAPGIRKIDSTLETASFAHGRNLLQTFKRITIPLSKPALLSTLIIGFIKSLEAFAIALWIGLPTRTFVFSTKIFYDLRFDVRPNYGGPTALAFILMVTGIILITFEAKFVGATQQYQTVSGESYSSEPAYDWGKSKNRIIAIAVLLGMFLVNLLPLLIMVYASFIPNFLGELTFNFSLRNYQFALTYPAFLRSLKNTILLMVVGSLVLMMSSFFSSYILFNTELRGRRILDYIMFVPIAAPGVVTGIGFLWAYLFIIGDSLPLYGTIAGILIALVSRYTPYATRSMHGGMASIGDDLEEVALVSGASPLEVLREVIAPLLKDNFAYGFIFLSILLAKNFTVVIFLYSSGSETLSVLTWLLWYQEAQWGATAALSVLIILLITTLSFIALKISNTSVEEFAI